MSKQTTPIRKTRKRRTRAEICESKYRAKAHITYNERKRRIHCSLDEDFLANFSENIHTYDSIETFQNTGLDFQGDLPLFKVGNRMFESELYNNVEQPTTYIYIISKTIGTKLFFKIGEGGKSDGNRESDPTKAVAGRLGDAQTFLTPGLGPSTGYQVHFVFYFLREYLPTLRDRETLIGMYVERQIHKILKVFFKQSLIQHKSERPSEWYEIEKHEILFFLGFVFDIISLMYHPITKPLKIWKYSLINNQIPSPIDTNKDVSLPTVNDAKERLKKFIENNDFLKDIQDSMERLRNPIMSFTTVADANDTDNIAITVREEYKVNDAPIYTIGDVEFRIISVKKPKPGSLPEPPIVTNRKYHIIYVGLELNKDKESSANDALNKENITYESQSDGDRNKLIYYISLQDFLHYEAQLKNQESYDNWPLKEYHEAFDTGDYDENITEIREPNVDALMPAFYFEKSIQDIYGRTFLYDKEYQYHRDYSINDFEKTQKKDWKIIFYDESKRHIQRALYDKELQTTVDNTTESIPVYKLMDLFEITKVNIKKKGKKNKWTKINNDVTHTLDGVVYGVNDEIQLRDNVFVYFVGNIPSGQNLTTWNDYIIDSFWKNNNADDTMNPNPYVDVIAKEDYINKNKVKSNCIKYTLCFKYLSNKIKIIKAVERTVYTPIFASGSIINVNKESPLFKMKLFENKNSTLNFSTQWKHAKTKQDVHYFKITYNKNRQEYSLQLLDPFDKYSESVNVKKIDEDTSLEQIKQGEQDDRVKKYKQELPYLCGYKIQSIIGHKPDTHKYTTHTYFVTNTNAQYVVTWSDGFKRDQYNREEPELVKKYANDKIEEYEKRFTGESSKKRTLKKTQRAREKTTNKTRKKKTTPTYELLEHINNKEKAIKNWNYIRSKSLKQMLSKKEPYVEDVIPVNVKPNFMIGDEFWDNDNLGYITTYFVDKKNKIVYCILFSTISNNNKDDPKWTKWTNKSEDSKSKDSKSEDSKSKDSKSKDSKSKDSKSEDSKSKDSKSKDSKSKDIKSKENNYFELYEQDIIEDYYKSTMEILREYNNFKYKGLYTSMIERYQKIKESRYKTKKLKKKVKL